MRNVARAIPRRRWHDTHGQTLIEFVLLAGLLVGIAIAMKAIIEPRLPEFFVRVVTSISGVAP